MACPTIPADPSPWRGKAGTPWLFQITSAPSFTGDSPPVPYYSGTRVQLSGTTYALSAPTGVLLYDPTRDKLNTENGNQELSSGDWVVAQYDEDSQRFVILQGSFFKIRRIQLTSNMSSGSASAKLLAWNGSAYAVTGSAFTVYDSLGGFSSAISGLNGFVVYEPDRGVWEILYLPISSTGYIGVLTQSLNYGTTTGATCNIYTGSPGSEAASGSTTVFPWMMSTGDSIPTNTEVVLVTVNGRIYAFNAACKNIYGS